MNVMHAQHELPKMALWGVPTIIFASWMVFPAVPDKYKGVLAPQRIITNAPHYKWDELDTMPIVRE